MIPTQTLTRLDMKCDLHWPKAGLAQGATPSEWAQAAAPILAVSEWAVLLPLKSRSSVAAGH